ncbi:MAG: tryptophan--tRNA ligase [Candidatus Sumerlaeota bacterium]|nr:tryptophan--tRNA ligase [Candidatus Sumerlaeota bacterium]
METETKERVIAPKKTQKLRLLSGMRPTGRLHLGNYAGALQNWVHLQHEYDAFFMVADWHAMTALYEDMSELPDNTRQVMIDFIAAGLDPERATLFVQSHIKEHAELALLLGMFTPVPWLERTPSYKEAVVDNQDKHLETLGFLGYPVLQAADIVIYKANVVPVGEDQVPHLEMCRELVRRVNFLYGNLFPEPQPILSQTPRLLGNDGRKMSKSYDNCIYLSDGAKLVEKKVARMVTDPARVRRYDLGHPEVCSVFDYHKHFNKREEPQIAEGCRAGTLGCVDCKKRLAAVLNEMLEPMRAKRAELEAKPKRVERVMADGAERAREAATKTMAQVRQAMRLP